MYSLVRTYIRRASMSLQLLGTNMNNSVCEKMSSLSLDARMYLLSRTVLVYIVSILKLENFSHFFFDNFAMTT